MELLHVVQFPERTERTDDKRLLEHEEMHMQIVNGEIINVVIYENPLVTIAYTKQRRRVESEWSSATTCFNGWRLPFTSSLAANPLNGNGNGSNDDLVALRRMDLLFMGYLRCCGHTRTEVLLVCNPFNSLVRCKFIGH